MVIYRHSQFVVGSNKRYI